MCDRQVAASGRISHGIRPGKVTGRDGVAKPAQYIGSESPRVECSVLNTLTIKMDTPLLFRTARNNPGSVNYSSRILGKSNS